ncbi:hypothetical protein Tco_0629014 [Tanacetum coccineum]|uniref:Uncharacterized protein n=1 Tax=Tanacetum coccineum TaxID=301880 RepID=A0ABQ4WRX0_9ASTR
MLICNLYSRAIATYQFFFYDDDDYEESTIPLNEIVSQIPPSIAITPVLPTLEHNDSLIMGNKELSTIPEKESDGVIKSCVEDLVPIPSESEDTFGSDSDCDLLLSDDLYPINSLSDEDVLEDNVKIYSNSLFEFDDEYISSDVNPLFDEVLENIERGEIDEINAFLDIDVSMDIENGYHDSEGDIFYLESLLINDTIPNLPPKVFLDHDPRSLKDELDKDDLMTEDKCDVRRLASSFLVFRGLCFMFRIALDYEDSRARGLVHRSLEFQSLACLYMGIRYPKSY